MSDVTHEQVITEMGFGYSEKRAELETFFRDVENDVTDRIRRAEAEIKRKTGRSFTVDSSDWHLYLEGVTKLAALKCIEVMSGSSSTALKYVVKGGVQVDKSEVSRSLRALQLRLERSVTQIIDILKVTTEPVVTFVIVEA